MDSSHVLFAVMLFVAAALAVEGLYQLWASRSSAEAKRLANRLRAIDAGDGAPLSLERRPTKAHWRWLDESVIAQLPRGDKILRYIETSGTGKSAGELALTSAVLGLAGFIVPMLLARPLVFSIFGTLVLGAIPWWRLARQRDKRMRLFEKQIPEALDLMGRALLAGHAFPTAVKMVGDEMQDPIGQEFRTLFDETNYGIPQNDALLRLAERVPIADLSYFVVAVMIQRESGGNLAELLEKISGVVRARLALLGQVRTLAAEGKLSAWILTLLPFGTALIINIITPKFMSILWTDPAGIRLVGIALLSVALGVLWMRKIIRIRV
jgi:tight adherence protein B